MNEQGRKMHTAGDILSYPYSFEQEKDAETVDLSNKLAKQRYEEQYKIAEIQNEQLYSPIREDFSGAQEFAKALFDMTEIEG